MMGIIAKYDLNHFLMTNLHQKNKSIFYLLSTVKICFTNETFWIQHFDLFPLKRD